MLGSRSVRHTVISVGAGVGMGHQAEGADCGDAEYDAGTAVCIEPSPDRAAVRFASFVTGVAGRAVGLVAQGSQPRPNGRHQHPAAPAWHGVCGASAIVTTGVWELGPSSLWHKVGSDSYHIHNRMPVLGVGWGNVAAHGAAWHPEGLAAWGPDLWARQLHPRPSLLSR